MDQELIRLASFSTWPESAHARPLLLAKHGFYYSGAGDRVTCFKCSVQLDNSTSADDVVERHRQQSPNCQLLSETNKENIPLAPFSTGDLGVVESDLAATKHLPGSEEIQEIYRGAVARATRKGIFATNPINKIDRSTPDYDQLLHEKIRLSTFYDWPSVAQANPQTLAREGLFYTGMEDRVQCAFCRGFMRNWEPTDIPSVEHKKLYPDCPFVRDPDVGNISMTREILASDYSRKTCGVDPHQHVQNSQPLRTDCTRSSIIEQIRYVAPSGFKDPPKYPGFSDVKRRIESFQKGKVAPGHTAETLAEAGWFFIGPGDKVQCFQCGGNLKDWEPEDDPWDEHKRWYANCSYFKTHRPAAIRQQLQEQTLPTTMTASAAQFRVEPREVKARMDTATVRAILDMGYSKELVRKAIEHQLSTTGDDFPNAESLLEAIFLMEATNPVASASGFTSTTSSVASHDAGRIVLMSSSTAADSSSSHTSSSTSTPLCNNSLHFADSHSLLAPNQSSSETPTSVFQSLVPRPSEHLPASATVSAVNTQETVADAQSKSKGKRKRNKKKKTPTASDAAETGEEDQTVEAAATRAANDPEILAQLEELKLNEISDEETLQYVEENRRLREARNCKVCMDAEVNTVFLPCGHLVCCNKCSPVLRNCPICRIFIRGTVKTFLS